MTVMEFSIFPLDKGTGLSKYVAEVIKIVEKSGLPFNLGPMGTVVEGELADLQKLLENCHEYMESVSDRVYMTAKFDTRKGAKDRITGKIESVKKALNSNDLS
ncbi:MAG: MTH1187 family thiamine-binding protein [Deltaproteobacteria bacterium]|nr:MTH1187 family thiamine-binding protein [Deltaproteobacteria bacterium]